MLKQKTSPRRRFIVPHHPHPSVVASPLYGLDYPPDHLRLVTFTGDPDDITRGILWFDRDLAAMPGDVNLWCGDRKAFYPAPIDARRVRVQFNCPICAGSAWNWDPSLGEFTGRDGCKTALAGSGLLQQATGPYPAGKIHISSITRYDSTTLDYTFSQGVTPTGDASGFWSTDDSGSTQSGSSIVQPAPETIRVSFGSFFPSATMPAGIVAGFTGISEAADLLSPITWRV